MSTATLTSKGQITIPRTVRHALGLQPGDRIVFVQVAPDRYELVAANGEVTALKGMFGPVKQVVSVAAMDRAIGKRGAAA